MYNERWTAKFPHVDGKDGRTSIENVIIDKLKDYFPGVMTNLWFNIQETLATEEHRILNPPSEADKERARAYAKRLGYTLDI